MQQTIDVIVNVLDATGNPGPGFPATGDMNVFLVAILMSCLIASCALLALRQVLSKKSKANRFSKFAQKFGIGFVVLTLAFSNLVIATPQAHGAVPDTLKINVTKGAAQSTQSVVTLPLSISNATGQGTEVKISGTASDLAQTSGTLAAPVALTDDSFGFALNGNPAATKANMIVNGFDQGYATIDSVAGLSQPFAGLDGKAQTVLQNEATGTSTVNLYLSARVAPSLALGSYHVTVAIEVANYPIDAPPPTPTTSVEGTIAWDDNNDQDGLRPTSASGIALELYKTVDGTRTLTSEAATFDVTANPWTYSFANLPTSEDGQTITYDVAPAMVPGYDVTQSGNDFTYTHALGTTSVDGFITWDDGNDVDVLRPATVDIELYKSVGGATPALVSGVSPTLDTSATPWAYGFANLPGLEGGQAVVYTVQAATPSPLGYTASQSPQNDFTYSHTPGNKVLGVQLATGAGSDFLNTAIARSAITSVVFTNTRPTTGTLLTDVSVAQNGSVMASWDGTSTLTIGADGGVIANTNSSNLFLSLNLTTLSLDNFHTERASIMVAMFSMATLPAGFTFPDGFGSAATDMRNMFADAAFSSDLAFPAGFGAQATRVSQMFAFTEFQGNLDWSQTTSFPNLDGTAVNNMFLSTVFNGHNVKVADATIQALFAMGGGGANIIV